MKETKVLNPIESATFQNDKDTKFLFMIDYSMAKVFKIKDEGFLVVPIHPMYSSLLIPDLDTVKHYIEIKKFPINEKFDSVFVKNEKRLLDFINQKEQLYSELLKFSSFDIDTLNLEIIDTLCLKLSENNKLDSLKINLMLLIGEHILQKTKNISYKWYLHKRIGGINPVYFPVLYNESEMKYIEIYERTNSFISEIKKYKKADVSFCIKMMLQFQKSNMNGEIVPFGNIDVKRGG